MTPACFLLTPMFGAVLSFITLSNTVHTSEKSVPCLLEVSSKIY